MLTALAAIGDTLVATASSNPRVLAPDEIAGLGRGHFARVEVAPTPSEAVARARALAGPDGAVLVTGSLYFLADLSADT